MEKPMKFPQKFSEIDKINYLQRKIILNSVMYYVYNKSFVCILGFLPGTEKK